LPWLVTEMSSATSIGSHEPAPTGEKAECPRANRHGGESGWTRKDLPHESNERSPQDGSPETAGPGRTGGEQGPASGRAVFPADCRGRLALPRATPDGHQRFLSANQSEDTQTGPPDHSAQQSPHNRRHS